MAYFTRIDDYRTYFGNQYDFHFDYNANSGGGQSFLAGTFMDISGRPLQPSALSGKTAGFGLRYRSADNALHMVNLSTDEEAVYEIAPRGNGSNQMKFSVDRKKKPSLIFPAIFMLPNTCGVNMAVSLTVSPLTTENYWLRSMWLECENEDGADALFVPKDFVFSGGSSKRRGVTAKEGEVSGETVFFRFDYNARINDILAVYDASEVLPEAAAKAVGIIAMTLRNERPFSYQACDCARSDFMRVLASAYPDRYSGYSDPLPLAASLIREGRELTAIIQEAVPRPHNLIYFGAPGTGKSYQLNKCATENFPEGNIWRVTFYPEYTYSQFVGCYKPVSRRKATQDASNEESSVDYEITYEFVPGPFLETYVKAWQNPGQNYLLIIEEINRANPATVFGDLFQLLDRDENGTSVYSVVAASDMRDWLKERVTEIYDCYGFLQLPPNLYIWATMNSADQGVFPMDTAFKRRWSFRYMGIDAGETELKGLTVELGEEKRRAYWNDVRKGINDVLLKAKVNEDKLLGPFFIKPADVEDSERFPSVFKEKVLLYLYEDAGKNKHGRIFADENVTYSQVCDNFDRLGVDVFREFPALTYLGPEDGETAGDEGDADGQDTAE